MSYKIRYSQARVMVDVCIKMCPIFGRPTIVIVCVTGIVVTIPIAGRAISVIRIATKTEAITITLSFNHGGRFQRCQSLCCT